MLLYKIVTPRSSLVGLQRFFLVGHKFYNIILYILYTPQA